MKKTHSLFSKITLLIAATVFLQTGCTKDDNSMDPSIVPNAKTFDGSDGLTEQQAVQLSNPNFYSAQVVQDYYSAALKLIKETPNHTPPIAARELGYIGITAYEATLVGNSTGRHSLAGQLNDLKNLPAKTAGKVYSPAFVANAALARIIKQMFANASVANLAMIDSIELANEQSFSLQYPLNNSKIIIRSQAFGHDMADAIYNWSKSDGGDQAYNNLFPAYALPVGPQYWVPTSSGAPSPMLPYWGTNRTFLPTSAAGVMALPPPPPAFSSTPGSAFYNAAMDVYTTVNNLTQAQKDIATFWADAGGTYTPPGHLMGLSLQIARNKNMQLGASIVLLTKVGIALNDAGIMCWRAKYYYNLVRPVSYIHSYIDPSFTTFIATPPFPSYASGHSTFSSSVACILMQSVGSTYAFNDSSKVGIGYPVRSFTTFAAMANEAALSRLYGGIHYNFDNTNGLVCGNSIGNQVKLLNF
jgi:membrane-associated phospholipid phosphatase